MTPSPRERALLEEVDAIHAALDRLGVTVRREALPEGSRGGFARVGGRAICFVPVDADPATLRDALLDALRRIPTEHVFLPPRVRALLDD